MSVEIIRVPKAPPQGLGQGNMMQTGEQIDAYVVQQLEDEGYTLLHPRRSARLAAAVPPRSYTGAMDPPGAYGWLYFKNTRQESKLRQARQAAAASRRAKKDAAASGEVSMDADSAPAAAAAAATSSASVEIAKTDDEDELARMFSGKMGFGGRRRKHRTRKSRKTRRRKTRRSTRA